MTLDRLVVTRAPPPGRAATALADLACADTAPADAAHKSVPGDTVAKFLFTSGSKGEPQGVINSQRMLTSNLAMIGASFPCLEDEPPVQVDWQPWNHTFGGKLEARFRGPNVTPGYWRDAALTAAAFDDEGFYRMGDALRFADSNNPRAGFVFDGRVAEDFKLSSGTWVSTGPLRASFIAAFAPYVRDIVIAGHDRDELTGIVLPDVEACRAFASVDTLQAAFATRLAAFARAASGSSTAIRRIVVLHEAPSIDAGEVTDKGSINQRAVLAHRAGLVEALYAAAPDARIIDAAPAAALQGA